MIDWPVEQTPVLVVIVDTEAELDWKARGPRRAIGVASVKCRLKPTIFSPVMVSVQLWSLITR
jgi:hypothetical protein